MRSFDEKVDSILGFTAEKLAEMESDRSEIKTLLGGTQFTNTASTKTLSETPSNFTLVDVRIYTSSHNTHFLLRGNSLMEQLSGSYTPKYFYIRTSDSAGATVALTPTGPKTFTIKHTLTGNMYVSVTGIGRIANN